MTTWASLGLGEFRRWWGSALSVCVWCGERAERQMMTQDNEQGQIRGPLDVTILSTEDSILYTGEMEATKGGGVVVRWSAFHSGKTFPGGVSRGEPGARQSFQGAVAVV